MTPTELPEVSLTYRFKDGKGHPILGPKGEYSAFGRFTTPGPDGKPVRCTTPSFRAKTISGVKAQLRDWERSPAFEKAVDAAAGKRVFTNGEFLEDWFYKKLPDLSITTQKTYTSIFETHIRPKVAFCQIPLKELALLDILNFQSTVKHQDETRNSASIKKNVRKMLNTAYRYAVRTKQLSENPMARLEKEDKPKVPKPQVRDLDVADERALMRYVDSGGETMWRAIVHLCLDAGLGPAELHGLRAEDIDFTGCKVHIRRNLVSVGTEPPVIKAPKADSRVRSILVDRETMDAVVAWMTAEPWEYVFHNGCELWRGDPFAWQWKLLLRRAGIRHYGFYSLRHTMATRLINAGMALVDVSKRLGHHDTAVTVKHYLHGTKAGADAGAAYYARRRAEYREASNVVQFPVPEIRGAKRGAGHS